MKPLPIADCTRRLGAPAGWDHEQSGICHTLEIADRDGFMVSSWQPTPVELERLRQGKPIYLGIQGRSHPVVFLMVGEE